MSERASDRESSHLGRRSECVRVGVHNIDDIKIKYVQEITDAQNVVEKRDINLISSMFSLVLMKCIRYLTFSPQSDFLLHLTVYLIHLHKT